MNIKLEKKLRSLNHAEPTQTDCKVEDLKTELYGKIIATHRHGFTPEKAVFTTTVDGHFFCQKIEEAINNTEYAHTIQAGDNLVAFLPIDGKVLTAQYSNIIYHEDIQRASLEPLITGSILSSFSLSIVGKTLVLLSGGVK